MKQYKMKVKGFTGKIKAGEVVSIVEINHGVATVRVDDRTDFVMMEDLANDSEIRDVVASKTTE